MAGSGNLDLGLGQVRIGANNTSSAFSGRITGTADSTLRKQGTGTMTLTNADNAFGSVRVDAGVLVIQNDLALSSISQGSGTNAIFMNGGDLTIENGAMVSLPTVTALANIENGTFNIDGAGSTLTGRRFDMTQTQITGNATLNITNDGLLSMNQFVNVGFDGTAVANVSSGGDIVTGNLNVGGNTGSNGELTVTDAGSTIQANSLQIGGITGSQSGGAGQVLIQNGAAGTITNEIVFFSNQALLTINNATLSTDIIRERGSNGVGVVALTDPTGGGSALTIGTNNGSSTFNGVISDASGGPGGFRKVGTGTFTLTGANTFTGATVIEAGSVVVSNANALQSSTVEVGASGTLQLDGVDANIGSLAGSGTVELGAQRLLTGANNGSTTFSGSIDSLNGLGEIDKEGTGTWTLTGSGHDFRQLRINAGEVVLDGAGDGIDTVRAASGDLTIQNTGSDFDLDTLTNDQTTLITGSSTVVESLSTLNNFNALTIEAGASVTTDLFLQDDSDTTIVDEASLTIGRFSTTNLGTIAISDASGGTALTVGSGNDSTFAGTIEDHSTGPGSVLKTGSGTVTLSGANTFSGDTQIDDGSIILGNANALQNTTVSINVDNGLDINGLNATVGGLAGSGALDIASNRLTVGDNNASTTYASVLSGSTDGQLRKEGTGTLTLSVTGGSFGQLRGLDGAVRVTEDLTLTSEEFSLSEAALFMNRANLSIENGATVAFPTTGNGYAVLRNGAMSITGAGSQLTGRRFDTSLGSVADVSTVTVSDGGNLTTSGRTILGTRGTSDLFVESGGSVVAANLGVGALNNSVGQVQVNGAGSTITAGNLTIGGVSAGQNGGSGTVRVESDGHIDVTNETTFFSDFTSLTIDGGTMSTGQLLDTNVLGSVLITNGTSGTPALTIGTNNGSSTFDGVIQDAAGGPGGLRKVGTGTLTLNGANTYSGGTTIEEGTLEMGSSSAAGSGTILINGGTLDVNGQTIGNDISFGASGGSITGTGTINTAVTLNNTNQVLNPGDSPGITVYGANQTWESFTYLWEVNNWEGLVAGANYDQLQIDGSLSLTGSTVDNYNLDITSLTAGDILGDVANFSETNNSWIILTTTTGITGFDAAYWTLLTDNFTSDPTFVGFFSLDVVGNDLVLTYTVPEPTTGALLLAGLGYMAYRRRR